MEIKYDVEIPKSDKEDICALYAFCESDKKNMCITYEDKHEAIKRRAEMVRVVNHHNLAAEITRIDNKVFVKKAGK